MHQFKSCPVPLSIRALHLPVLFTKKMVTPDNKVQLHHIHDCVDVHTMFEYVMLEMLEASFTFDMK